MTRAEIIQQIKIKQSFLCIGLDPDIKKIPQHLLLLDDPLFEFCKSIVDATNKYCVAYKPNTAFFEAHGVKGWTSFEKIVNYIKINYPNQFVIADAKRGDIGNTSDMYARCFFKELPCDAITVSPYMGKDSVVPFLNYENKWTIVLAHTSNEGAHDFQNLLCNGKTLYTEVLVKTSSWGNANNLMFVVGATKANTLLEIRKTIPKSFLLVPGVGAQGGSLEEVFKCGSIKDDVGLLINSSRGIIYASSEQNFAEKAAEEALHLQQQMKMLLA